MTDSYDDPCAREPRECYAAAIAGVKLLVPTRTSGRSFPCLCIENP